MIPRLLWQLPGCRALNPRKLLLFIIFTTYFWDTSFAIFDTQCKQCNKTNPERSMLGHELNQRFDLSESTIRRGGVILYIMGMVYMFVALALVCDDQFVPALEVISDKWGLSDDVAGATFMAAGGSAPELFTSFVGVFITKTDVGFGTVLGSAVFNILFVIAICSLFSNQTLILSWWPLARDSICYAIALSALALFFGYFSPQLIEFWEAGTLLLLYVFYIILMKYNYQLHDIVTTKVLHKTTTSTKITVIPKVENKTWDEEHRLISNSDPSMSLGTRETINRCYINMLPNFRHPSTIRLGMLQLSLNHRPILDSYGKYVIYKIQGDVYETFNRLDVDQNGYITRVELYKLLSLLSVNVTDDDVSDALNAMDLDGDNKISYEEFRKWYISSQCMIKAQLEVAFDSVSEDSEAISIQQMKKLIMKTDERYLQGIADVDNYIKCVFKLLDENNDGLVSKEEFFTWYAKSDCCKSRITEAIRDAEEVEGAYLEWPKDGPLRAQIIYVLTFPLAFALDKTCPDPRKPEDKYACYFTFLISIAWIALFSYLMIWWATVVGACFEVPDVIMGLTFIAAGTSIPDMISSLIVARQGHGDMAVSSSIGSNIFDILIGLPLPWFAYNIYSGKGIKVQSMNLFPSLLILTSVMILVILAIAVNGWKLTKKLGGIMLLLYFFFVLQVLLRHYL